MGKVATNPQNYPKNPKYLLPSAEHTQRGRHGEGTCLAAQTSCLALVPPYVECNCGYKRWKAPNESRGGLHFPMLLIVFISLFSTAIAERRDEKKNNSGPIRTVFSLNFPDKWCWRAAWLGELLELPSPLSPPLLNAGGQFYQYRTFPMKTLILN